MRIEQLEFNEDVEKLLKDADLHFLDLRNSKKIQLFGLRVDANLIGIVGVEPYGATGLLRSLAVLKSARKSGYGKALVEGAEAWALDKGIRSLYLLTATAADFFSRIGYEVVPRTLAPVSIAGTDQFADLCPLSAVFMRKNIDG